MEFDLIFSEMSDRFVSYNHMRSYMVIKILLWAVYSAFKKLYSISVFNKSYNLSCNNITELLTYNQEPI